MVGIFLRNLQSSRGALFKEANGSCAFDMHLSYVKQDVVFPFISRDLAFGMLCQLRGTANARRVILSHLNGQHTDTYMTPRRHCDTKNLCFWPYWSFWSIWSIGFFGKKIWMALYWHEHWLASWKWVTTLLWVSRHTKIPIEHGLSRDLDLLNATQCLKYTATNWAFGPSSGCPQAAITQMSSSAKCNQHTIPRYKSHPKKSS